MLACAQTRADYPSTIINGKPAGYWRFNESGLQTTLDAATNQGTLGSTGYGIYTGGAIHPVAGALVGEPSDTATSFAGDNGYVGVPYSAALGSAKFTVEAWVRPSVSPPPSGQSGLAAVLSCGHLAAPRTGWLIYQSSTGWNLRGYNGVDSTAVINITGGPTPVAGTWYHIAATFDGAIAHVYVNGVDAAVSSTVTTYAANTDGQFAIGTRSDIAFPYAGDVDEVAYYSTTLSASTIASHYTAGLNATPSTPYATLIGASSPAVYLRLDEPAFVSPSTPNFGTLGSSANGSYIYQSGTTSDFDSPAYPGLESTNTVLQTSGSNGFVKIPALNLNTNAVTMECWFKPNGIQDSFAALLFHRGDSGTATGIMYQDVTGNIGYHWNDTSSTYSWISHLSPADGVWNYAALAVSSNQATLYLWDGATWQSAVNQVTHDVEAFAGTTRVATDSGTGRFFKGLIDEPAIYSTTLPEGQLHTHVLAAIGGSVTPTIVTDLAVTPDEVHYTTVPFTLSVDAFGTPPLIFTWRRDGVAVAKTTNVWSYTKTAVASDAGSYDVVISNASGSVTSSAVSIAINSAVPPTIDLQPASRATYAGGISKFRVAASGTTPMYYQWKHAGTNIPGATNATVAISNVDSTVTGSYTAVVTNVAGITTSSAATLSIRTPAVNSYEAAVVAAGPLAYWRLNETSGSYAYDSMSGYDATNTDGTTLAQPGPRASSSNPGFESSNYAYLYDGVAAQSSTGVSLLNNRTNVTVSGWVNIPGAIARGGLFGQNNVFEFRFLDTTTIELWTPSGYIDYTFTGTVSPDQWVFLTYVGTGTSLKLYINGTLAATATTTATAGYGTSPYPFIFTGDTSGNGDASIAGYLDEVAMFNRALSDNEISALYSTGHYGQTKAPFITAQPIGSTLSADKSFTLSVGANGSVPLSYQWSKNGTVIAGATNSQFTIANTDIADSGSYSVVVTNVVGSITSSQAILVVYPLPLFANLTNGLVLHLTLDGVYTDSSGNGHDAAIVGDVPFVAGRVGQGINIASAKGTDSGNNYAYIYSAPDLEFDENASFSVGFWINYTARFNDTPIIGNAINSTYQPGWVFTDEGGKIEWSLASPAPSHAYVGDPVANSPTVGDGQWHHIVGVVDRSTKYTFVYVDGSLAGSWSIDGLGTLATGNAIALGEDPNGNYGSATFSIDDIAIWNRALTAYDATSAYVAGQNGKTFNVYGPVKLYARSNAAGVLELSWQAGTLQSASSIKGPWTDVSSASAPYLKVSASDAAKFYRVKL